MRTFLASFVLAVAAYLAPFAAAKPVSAEYYGRLPAIYDADISPDGNWLAAVIDNNGQYILRVFDLNNLASGKVRAAPYPKDIQIEYVKWANNDKILVSTSQSIRDGSTVIPIGQLYVLNKDLSDARQVLKTKQKQRSASRFNNQTAFRQFNNVVVDFLPNDPDHILMSFGEEDRFIPDVHKVNLGNSSTRTVQKGNPDAQRWITDLNNEVRISEGRNEVNGTYKMAIRTSDGSWKSSNNFPGIEATTDVFGFTSNPDELIIGDYADKNTMGLYVYNLASKRRTRKLLHNDQYDVSQVIYSPDRKKVVGAKYIADGPRTVFFDPGYKAKLAKIQAKLPGYQIRYISETPDGSKTVLKASTPSVPSILYVYDRRSDTMQNLGYDYPEIAKNLQGDVSKVKYTARDGYKITGYVTTPPKIADGMPFKNLPFVILPHGGPYSRDALSFDYLAQFFVSRGYAVLQMNFRGSDGLGLAHLQAGRTNWEVMQEDVEDGAKWLASKGYADKKRICIAGWSYGGYAALMGAIKNPDLYACVVSIAGLTDPQAHVYDMKKFRFGQHNAKTFILNGFDGSKDIKKNTPVDRAGEIKIPVFLAHGTEDGSVNFNQYRKMKSALKASKSKHTFMEFNDDHYMSNSDNRIAMFKGLDKFMQKNLGASAAAP